MAGTAYYRTESCGHATHSFDCADHSSASVAGVDLAHDILVASLRQRIRELEALIAGDHDKYLGLGITSREAIVLGALMRRKLLSLAQVQILLSNDIEDTSGGFSRNTYAQIVKRLRKKLAPHGVKIMLRWGAGYYITTEDKAKL